MTLEIELDEDMCSMMDYFEIFLQRMLMCKKSGRASGNEIQDDRQWK